MVNKSVNVKITVDGYEDAKLKLERLNAAEDEMIAKHPEIAPTINAEKALLEARILRDAIKHELSDITMDPGVSGGFLGKLGTLLGSGKGGIGGALGGIPGVGGPLASAAGALGPQGGLVVAAGATAAAGALLVEITGIVSGITAAAAGLGAFGALAIPTFTAVTGAVTTLSTDTAAYQAAVGDAAKDKALAKIKADWAALDPAQKQAVKGVQALQTAYDNMAKSFEPIVLKVLTPALKAVSNLLPTLVKPLATAAGNALAPLLAQFSKFTQSQGFKDWVKQFSSLVGPAITAIGHGVGELAVNFGKLLTTMSRKDVVTALNIAFRILSDTIKVVTGLIKGIMLIFDVVTASIKGQMGIILKAATLAFGWIPGLGPLLRRALGEFDSFAGGVTGALGGIDSAAGITAGLLAAVGNAALNALSAAKGASSLAGIGSAAPHAAGGPASGLIRVGELGPELLSVPPGSYVYNHAQTAAMTSGGYDPAQINDLIGAVDNLAGILIQGNRITAGVGADVGAALNTAARGAGYRALYPTGR